MEKCYGQHGWKEFNNNRQEILAELDRILALTQNRPIKVAHGTAVEAYIRKWLSEFLPKKYGVTSGYIVPDLYDNSAKLYHYDIIIYNQFEAPVLWTEGNFDQSEQGKYRAIPAKHVSAVYEVKSRLTKDNVVDALEKLGETKAFASQLSASYTCGVIFIDLKESDNNNASIIKALAKGVDTPGFVGGMVMRYEKDTNCTGVIRVASADAKADSNNQHLIPIAKPIDDLDIFATEKGSIVVAEQGGGAKLVVTAQSTWSVAKLYGVTYHEADKATSLFWSHGGFADFSINLISNLEGLAFNDKNRPVFGQIFDFISKKKAPLQDPIPKGGKPFLTVKLYEGNQFGDHLIIRDDAEHPTIEFIIQIENRGESDAIVWESDFASRKQLEANRFAVKPAIFECRPKKTGQKLSELLRETPLELPYRLVYHPVGHDDEIYAVEMTAKITNEKVELLPAKNLSQLP